jgi:adenylate kinase family enzyme
MTKEDVNKFGPLAGNLLILTGPPGSGKTTIAHGLAKQPGSPKVHLHADDFWHFIKHGSIAPYLPEAHEQNRVVVDVLAKVAEGYAKGGYFIILDGIIGPWFLQPFKKLDVKLHYIVLRPPLEVAIQRCRERGGDTLTDPTTITALHQQLSSLGELERYALRTEGQSRDEMLSEITKAVHSGAFCMSS